MNLAVDLLPEEVVPSQAEWITIVGNFGEVLIARYYLSMSTHRGGVSTEGQPSLKALLHPASWEWQGVVATVWKLEGEHIDNLEWRACGLKVRWTLRRHYNVGSRFVHLVYSLVTLSAMAERRFSSVRLSRVVAC